MRRHLILVVTVVWLSSVLVADSVTPSPPSTSPTPTPTPTPRPTPTPTPTVNNVTSLEWTSSSSISTSPPLPNTTTTATPFTPSSTSGQNLSSYSTSTPSTSTSTPFHPLTTTTIRSVLHTPGVPTHTHTPPPPPPPTSVPAESSSVPSTTRRPTPTPWPISTSSLDPFPAAIGPLPPEEPDPYFYEDFRHRCPPESSESIWWNETSGGVIAARRCSLGYMGTAYRMCFYGGTWGQVDSSECRVAQLIRLKHLVYYHVHKNLTDGFHSLAEELSRILRSYRLRGLDDVMEALDALNIMLNARMRLDLRLAADAQFVKTLLDVGDRLFTREDHGWAPPQNQQDQVTLKVVQVLHSMGFLSVMVADGLKRGGLQSFQVEGLPHTGLLAQVTDSKSDYVFSRFHGNQSDASERLVVPASFHRQPGVTVHSVMVTLWFRGLQRRLNDPDTLVTSALLSSSVHPGTSYRVAGPVLVSLRARQRWPDNQFTVHCSTLRRTSNRSSLWSSNGCTVKKIKGRDVTCQCYHVNNVAVILRRIPHEPPKPKLNPVNVVVLVGCCFALATLLLTLLAHAHLLRADASEGTVILFHLVVSMVTTQIVFMAGIQATSNKEVCEGVALVLHYLHLVTSFWLLVHGIHLYLRLRCGPDAPPPRHLRDYCLLAWVVPVILVVATFIVNPKGYETRRYCWLSIERGMVLSFIVPISALIMINTTLMVLVLKHFFELRAITRKIDIDRIRIALRVGVVLLPLFGVNWFLGVLALEDTSTSVFEAAFAFTNSLQGLLLFLFNCICNAEIRHALCRRGLFFRRKPRKPLDLRLRRSRKRRRKVDAEPLLVAVENPPSPATAVSPDTPTVQEVAT